MSVFLSPNLPANVVEIGNEISQAKINEINAGTLATQTWVSASYLTTASASSTYAPKASPTFTGTVTIPAGASISGYLTTASAASTYQTISGMSSYATQSYVTSQGYITDAPSDGSEYVRKNAAWAIATGGGGISDAPSDGNLYARQNAGWTSFTIPVVPPASVTNIDLTGNFNGYSMGSGYYTFKFDSTTNELRMQDGNGKGITIGRFGQVTDVTDIGTSTTLDGSQSQTLNVLSTYTVSVPQDSSYDYPIGTKFFVCGTSGIIVDNGMTSATVNGGGSYTTPSAGVSVLIKVAANTWYIS